MKKLNRQLTKCKLKFDMVMNAFRVVQRIGQVKYR